MKIFFKKLNTFLALSAFSAGIVFFACGFFAAVPKGVTVNGINVGGMTQTAAASAVRGKIEENLKTVKLVVCGKKSQYVFGFPEIYYKDNLNFLLKTAERNKSYFAEVEYYLCGLNEIAAGICLNERVSKIEPYAEFRASGEPFVYRGGNDGLEADAARLKNDILASLKNGFTKVEVKYKSVKRQTTVEQAKQNTVLLGSFSTVYDNSNINRSSNIRLAAARLNGSALAPGETLSFNGAVGARLPERGFLPAKIIENGEYTEGVGGGVCQVSTTLYNAALLSGMEVTEFHPHSLPVSYVAPSRDAMVSGSSCDLKFKNPSAFPVYIRAQASDGVLNFKIYGKSDGAVYSVESVVTGAIPAPEERCDDPSLARPGKDGILSESYLLVNRGGFIKRIKLRSDRYLPQKRVVLAVTEDQPDGGGRPDTDI